MQTFVTSLAAGAALALFASSGQAACDFHKMKTASTPAESVVAMSTPAPAAVVIQDKSAATTCPADAKDCAPANK